MKIFIPLVALLLSTQTFAKVEIQSYRHSSWNNEWNESISEALDKKTDSMIMSGQIDVEDLKELECVGYNNLTDNDLKKDFWIVFFSALTRAESAFNPNARAGTKKRAGNHGLLQLAKATARNQCGIDAEEIYLPANQLSCGVKLLAWQLEGAPTSSGKQLRPDLKGQLFGKRILLWGPLRQNDKRGRKLLTGWFKKHLDQLPFCKE